ncbi:MAG TPA: nitroreductase family deazaflavin-dependent oxidoreductase [Anaerolineales bacterium]|nr:nitroreductase family deazaflavin-dependent oxidoreductase [Anaerolineales bacterium]
MTNLTLDRPLGKALRFALRLPIWLYRLHLGWLLGDRFLMLTHVGRKSGRPYETVIEVVRHDKEPDTYYVVSGWGDKSDWYQNIQKSADVTVHVAGRKFQARAKFIPLAKAIEIMEAYAHEHSLAFRELSSLFLGEHIQSTSDAPRRLAEKMPMVAFHLVQSN